MVLRAKIKVPKSRFPRPISKAQDVLHASTRNHQGSGGRRSGRMSREDGGINTCERQNPLQPTSQSGTGNRAKGMSNGKEEIGDRA